MIRKLALTVAALAIVASPAAAQSFSMRVSLIGKNRATIEADVTAAAQTVCRQAVQSSDTYSLRQCIVEARGAALNKIAAVSTRDQMASL
jgi:hypothetical protein